MSRHFASLEALRAAGGTQLGSTDWVEIDQQRIDRFAEATEDFQWIHVDPLKAAVGPFGTTIAHGFLTLALVPRFVEALLDIEGVALAINYGLNRVRFPAPVPVDSRLRGSARLVSIEDVPGGVQAVVEMTIQREGSDKPVCVAESLVRFYGPGGLGA